MKTYVARTLPQYVRRVTDLCENVGTSAFFRGHRNGPRGMWSLLPVLYRDPQWSRLTLREEAELYENFRLTSSHLIEYTIEYLDEWAWLACMRHHGGATRLLDWTQNPLTALFFAIVEGPGGAGGDDEVDASVWILDPPAFNEHACGDETLIFPKRHDELDIGPDHQVSPEEFTYYYLPGNLEKICRVPPELPICVVLPLLDPRQAAQHGVFTVHGRDRRPIEEIAEEAGFDQIYRVDIPGREVPKMRQHLWYWISETDVFPDLDHVCARLRREFAG